MLQWFWDEELQIECVFARNPDGTIRCLPRDGAMATESDGGVFGLDPRNHPPSNGADCMAPAVHRPVCDFDTASGYVYVSSPMCGPGPVVREVFRLSTSLDEMGSWTEDGVCDVHPVFGDWAAYSLTSVDPAIFVAAEQVVGAGVRTLVGEDGSWQNLELALEGGQGCFPLASGAEGPCVPSPAGFAITASSDEACRLDDVGGEPVRPQGCSYTPSHALPIYADEVLRDVAGTLEVAYGLGVDDGTCEPDSGRYYLLGNETSLESLQSIEYVDIGAGGVVARHSSFDGFSKSVPESLVDNGTGDNCATWSDGERRWCIPRRVQSSSSRFADPGCTQVASVAYFPLPFLGMHEWAQCATSWTFYEAELFEGSVYERSDGLCVVDENAAEYRYTFGELLETESVLDELFLEDAAPPV